MAVRKSRKYDASDGSALQLGMFAPPSDWTPTPVSQLPSWANARRISIDCECYDPLLSELGPGCRRQGYVVGWSFAIEGGPSYYLPYRHEGGGNLPEGEVLAYLRDNVRNFRGEVVGANLDYDLDWAATDGITFDDSNVMYRDVQIADPLIYELYQRYSLKAIGERWGVQAKDEELLEQAAHAAGVHPKKGLWRLHSKYVGGYAERDTQSPLEIYRKQEKKIEELELNRVFDLECRVLPVLLRMRQRGVLIDQEKLSQISFWAGQMERQALQEIKRDTGVDIGFGNVWKTDAVAPAIEAIGVRLGRTSKGAPNIDAKVLESLNHPVASNVRRARKFNKLRTTFAASIERYMVKGRIHCTFNQVAREDEDGDQKGVRYGRLSAVDPNLQQQPSKDRDPEVAGEWRKIFIAEPGSVWGSCDYSQQEPRWTTHFAAVMDLPRAREAAQRYVDDPNADNHDMMTRLVHGDHRVSAMEKGEYKVKRAACKNIFLGICYGEGGPKLCRDIGLPTRWALLDRGNPNVYFDDKADAFKARALNGSGFVQEVAGEEGQAVLNGFDEAVPYVRKLSQKANDTARRKGFVKTVMGRRLHFLLREDGSYDWTHKALNRVIQGSSADQMKLALVELDRAGHFVQLQVHDEENGSCSGPGEVRQKAAIMRDCILQVTTPLLPFKVDAEYGPNWGDLRDA